MTRRGYLDWLRGVAVLIMIEAHTLDAWTRMADRSSTYGWAMVVAGYGAPFFMFLAGIALVMGAGGRQRKGLSDREATAKAQIRGLQVLGLAFVFRAQSWLVSGASLASLLKVDILNIMGLSMIAAGTMWGWGRTRWRRAALLTAAAVSCTMVTPIVREASIFDSWPTAAAAYLRPMPGRTTFTLFPWAGFLFAGSAVGVWLDAVRSSPLERGTVLKLGALGVAVALGGYAASFLPSLYSHSEFWTSSPTYFFVRLGVLLASLPVAYLWTMRWPGWSPLIVLGRSSLFVYWVHVEIVYGLVSRSLHRSLTLQSATLSVVVFIALMYALTRVKERLTAKWRAEPAQPPQLSVVS